MASVPWPAVIVGAAVLGGLLGAVQPDEPPAGDPQPSAAAATPVAASARPPAPSPSPVPTAATAVPSPSPGQLAVETWPDPVRSVLPAAQAPRIALTFDDGPHPTWTPLVLDELARHGVTATFCLVGSQIPGNEALVERMAAEGHALCNHTMAHDYGLPTRPAVEIDAEIAGVTALVEQAAPDARLVAFRAPGGRFEEPVLAAAGRQGLVPWAWSVDPEDWTDRTADEIVAAVLESVAPGAVVVLHDGGGDQSATVAALAELIPLLQSVGYEFVALPEG